MKIFGITFETKRELRQQISELRDLLLECSDYVDDLEYELDCMQGTYPFDLGMTVYDIQLRGENGRYTKTKPSLAHSIINEVIVDEKNYFKLRKRMEKNDVFMLREKAEAYLEKVCK